MQIAYEEEGIPLPGSASLIGKLRLGQIPEARRYRWFKRHEPLRLIYPRSFVEGVRKLSHEKRYRYNFVGLVFRPDVFPYRKWLLDFARRHFGPDCYFCATSLEGCEGYEPLGVFDHTLENQENGSPRFIPRDHAPESRHRFDEGYFTILAQSRFTLCPRGDSPWSMRFFEAIMCKSIPVVEDPLHSGRNELERRIGYKFYTLGSRSPEEHRYRPEWAEFNYERFLRFQTLLTER